MRRLILGFFTVMVLAGPLSAATDDKDAPAERTLCQVLASQELDVDGQSCNTQFVASLVELDGAETPAIEPDVG